jgi:hypothetical protein
MNVKFGIPFFVLKNVNTAWRQWQIKSYKLQI